ncbi:MAG: LamG domain-containing protein [Phycisphaerales bacterium]|nr:LamG domain-containing protein [Phycisphaerales bacterium]
MRSLHGWTLIICACIAVGSARAELGLVGHWMFEEGSGTAIADSSGNGHNGTALGQFTFSADVPPGIGSQYSGNFAGVSYIRVPDAPALDPSADFTLAAWVKTYVQGGYNFILIKHIHGVNNDGSWMWGASRTLSGQVCHYFIATPWSGEQFGDTSTWFPLNEWHHMAYTYVDATDTFTIYLDGVPLQTGTRVWDIADNAAHLGIGGTANGTGGNFQGKLDDVRLYNRALSSQEIAQIVNPTPPAQPCWSWDGLSDPGFASAPQSDPGSYYDPVANALHVAYGARSGISQQNVYHKQLSTSFDSFVAIFEIGLPDIGYWIDVGVADGAVPWLPTFQVADLRMHVYNGPAGPYFNLETCDYDTNHNLGYAYSGHPQQGQTYRILLYRTGTLVGGSVARLASAAWQPLGAVGPVHRPGLTEPFDVIKFDQPEYGDFGYALVSMISLCETPTANPGDLNCDGVVDFDDIDPFVAALSGPATYYPLYPSCNWLAGDCNVSGNVNFNDIDPFIALIGTTYP